MDELTVYIDESGNTGDVARDDPFGAQPTFALVGLAEAAGSGATASVLADVRKKHQLQAMEIKSRSVRDRPAVLVDLLAGLAGAGVTPVVELMDKRYYVANNIVTWVLGQEWLELSSPLALDLANDLAEVVATDLGEDTLVAYAHFAKVPSAQACDVFLRALRQAVASALVEARGGVSPERLNALVFSERASARAQELSRQPGFVCERFLQAADESPGGHRLGLLPQVQALWNLCARINFLSRGAPKVRLLHDEQKEFGRLLREYFDLLTSNKLSEGLGRSAANERAGVDWNFIPGRLELCFVNSRDHAGIQAADVVGGFCARRLNTVMTVSGSDDRFDVAARHLDAVPAPAGMNFVTTRERMARFRALAPERATSTKDPFASMPTSMFWLALEHACGCVMDWGCDAAVRDELTRALLPAVVRFPCPWHGPASGSAPAPTAVGEVHFGTRGRAFFRRAADDQREDGRRNRDLALSMSRAASGSR